MRFFFSILIVLAISVPVFGLPNEVSYTIEAELLPEQNIIVGSQSVTFTNRSESVLDQLYFHLYPNAFQRDELTQYQLDLLEHAGPSAVANLYANPDDDAYIDISLVQSNGDLLEFTVEDTLLTVTLAEPVSPAESVVIDIHFLYDMMEATARDLMAYSHAVRSAHRQGIYSITLWYPKLAVFDDDGWFLEPYRYFGEFYGDFASYNVQITLPESFEVGATGNLVLEAVEDDSKTLLFNADQVHDFAWVASENYQTREYEIENITVRALYVDGTFGDLGELAVEALQYFTDKYGSYPYENFTVAQVKVGGGMEYPMLAVIGQGNESEVVHEVAHQWWYGAVGNNEMTEPWLDEAFTTLAEELFFIEHQGREEAFVRSSRFFIEPGEIVVQPAHKYSSLNSFGRAVYTKGSGILWMLRSYLGPILFDEMLKAYYDEFKLSNVTTEDFTEFVKEYTEQDLDWFFDQWLRTTDTLDIAVTNVHSIEQPDGSREHVILLENLGNARMPVTIEIIPGDQDRVPLRVKWDGQESSFDMSIDEFETIRAVQIDPDDELLEIDRSNNAWFSQNNGLVYVLGIASIGMLGLIATRLIHLGNLK